MHDLPIKSTKADDVASFPSPCADSSSKSRLTPQEVSERWGVSIKTLERWRHLGTGPVYVRLPGKVVYRLEDIETFERHSLRKSTDEAFREGGEV